MVCICGGRGKQFQIQDNSLGHESYVYPSVAYIGSKGWYLVMKILTFISEDDMFNSYSS